jgi:hypothetical protein
MRKIYYRSKKVIRLMLMFTVLMSIIPIMYLSYIKCPTSLNLNCVTPIQKKTNGFTIMHYKTNAILYSQISPFKHAIKNSRKFTNKIVESDTQIQRTVSQTTNDDGHVNRTFKFLINNEHVCNRQVIPVEILIIIATSPGNYLLRNTLRETWLRNLLKNNVNIRYIFLLGQSNHDHDINQENQLTNDIIMGDFNDTYTHLTEKTIMGYQWAVTYCKHTKFIMKCDDDIYINIEGLQSVVKKNRDRLQTGIGGRAIYRSIPVRNKSNVKWYISFRTYPHDRYPPYCLGGPGYLTSFNVVAQIVNLSRIISYFSMEDVFIGMCIKKLKYRLYDIKGFHNKPKWLNPCLYTTKTFVSVHRIRSNMVKHIWKSTC